MFLRIQNEKGEMSDDSLSDVEASSAQRPVKKGLSKYYKGKSQSFTSISEVPSVEDLAKKQLTPYRSFKSPQVMTNKGSTGSCASSAARGRSRPPHIPMQKNF